MGFLQTNNSSLACWLRRRACRYISQQSPVVVGGCPRSGTTLLRVMLDSHPRIACGPENSLLAGSFLLETLVFKFDLPSSEIRMLQRKSRDHTEFIELFYNRYLEIRGKRRWGDKQPSNIHFLDFIFRHFPNTKFIHIIRDGRDTVCSLRTHPKYRLVNRQRVLTGIRRPLRSCIRTWLRDTAAGMNWRGHPNYTEVHYEELVEAPESTLRKLCVFLDEPWGASMLEYYLQKDSWRDPNRFVANFAATKPLSREAIQRWRTDLSENEQRVFYELAGQRLTDLGYSIDERRSVPRSALVDIKQSVPQH